MNSSWFKFIVAITLTCFSFLAFAEIREPNPSDPIENAFNFIVGPSAFERASYLFRGLTSVSILTFTAWAIYGIFEAHFVEKQIAFKTFIILFVKQMAMTTILIILINL